MADLPECFNLPGAGFVTLPAGVKFPPPYAAWQLPENARTFAQARAHKGNVGILAGGGYIGLDKDNPAAFGGLELPITTLWETRPGRYGMRFKVSDNVAEALATIGKKADLAQLYLYRNGKQCGEIKLQRSYQTIPPSWKKLEDGTRADYRLLDSSPPATITLAKLLSDLQAIGITFSTKLEQNAAKLEGMGKKARQRNIETDEARTLRYAAAALRDEVLTLAGTPEGNRNKQLNNSAFNLGQFVAVGLLSEDEVISELTRAAENTGLDSDAIRKTVISGMEAGKQHPREIPANDGALSAEQIMERIQADPRALKDPTVINGLAALKANDPVEYDLVIDGIKKKHKGIKVDTIHGLVDTAILESRKATDERETPPSDVAEDAQQIINAGEAYEHIYKIWQKRVKGNEYLGKALLVSRGVQSCLNTKGLHVYAHGKHGHGKSEGMEKMIELVPPEFRMDEDVSPLAIHYASKNDMLLPGTTILIDEMIWNDSLAGVIKRVITRFQKGAGHLTVIDGDTVLVRTKPRLAIWTNSADLQADEQLRDRFLDEPIAEGEGHVKTIIEFQKVRDTLPESSEETARETAVCQAILRDLAGKLFTVKIPFATRINIAASEGTRGYNIFSDLVKGLAAMRYAQRETNDQGQLLATEADFKDAKDIYEGSKGHSEEHYATAETKVLQAIIDHGYKALYKDIKNLTGMSEGRIKDIVNGRGKDEQKRHGLRYKCSQLDVNTVDISTVIKGTYSDRVTTHPVELSLPASFSLADGVRQNLVSLDPDVERRNQDVDQDVVDIDSNRDSDVVDVVEEIREKEDTSKSQTSSLVDSTPSSKVQTQKDYVTTSQSLPITKNTTSESATPCVDHVDVAASEKIRIAARQEYGVNGWVDPRKVAAKLHIELEAVEAWLQAQSNYVRTPSGNGYTQRSKAEA